MLMPSELMDFQYYVDKCPLYLQNSEGFVENFKIWFDFLVEQVSSSEELLDLINVFDVDYFDKINDHSDMLDKIASIYNIKRNFSVDYHEGQTLVHKTINLNNKDFLTFIRATIIKNYSDGTYSQMSKFYLDANLSIIFVSTGTSATVNVYLINLPNSSYTYSEDIKSLFYAGLLTIESMGIEYLYSIQDYDKILIWDKEVSGTYTGWDYGEWAI